MLGVADSHFGISAAAACMAKPFETHAILLALSIRLYTLFSLFYSSNNYKDTSVPMMAVLWLVVTKVYKCEFRPPRGRKSQPYI